MAPGGIGPPARLASAAANSQVLFVRNANDNLVKGHPHDLAARPLQVRNVLEHLGAEHAIEGAVRELEVGRVSGYGPDTRKLKAGRLKVKCGYFREMIRQ